MNKIKIGVMGAYRGKAMIDVLMEYYEDAELVAVCDMFEPALKNVKRQAEDLGLKNISYYTEFDEFLKHDMDAVVLANYATEHAPFAIRCLSAGKHVMSEVLPCETMAQAVELIEAVEKSGKVYAYAENYCYMQDTFEMWKKYESGEIGVVQYAEGQYIHDCSKYTPQLTYGDKNHWRNRLYSTFYCTHSLGPVLTITGRRPVQVVGFETNYNEKMREITGRNNNAGIEMVTLDNGAVVRSVHGGLKREPWSVAYQVYATKGMMESGRFEGENHKFNCYVESDRMCEGEWQKYEPESDIRPDMVKKFPTHGGSDFYSTYFFIQKILGRPNGKWSIDVYKAVDMGICGILAWRSILNGNKPVRIPNLRNPEERDEFRNDNACASPEIAGDQLVPIISKDASEVSEETYERMRRYWQEGLDANGERDTFYSAILDVTDENNK